jgi:hypothetical protein
MIPAAAHCRLFKHENKRSENEALSESFAPGERIRHCRSIFRDDVWRRIARAETKSEFRQAWSGVDSGILPLPNSSLRPALLLMGCDESWCHDSKTIASALPRLPLRAGGGSPPAPASNR